MNFLLRAICFIMLLCCLGCASQNAQELMQCRLRCAEHLRFCTQNCSDNCPTCSWISTQNACANFSKYVHERAVEGKKVMRELNSYRDLLKCRKVTCNCRADLIACEESCSGIIHKRLHLQKVPSGV
jgi:hypothetical protein